jgi:hypothetical protein
MFEHGPARRLLAAVATIGTLCASLNGCAQVSAAAIAAPAPSLATGHSAALAPSPDYGHPQAWLAFPGRDGPERSTPPGFVAVDEATAAADVFFIHPTTYLKNDVENAAYNADGPYDMAVLLGQISAFNGCCRIYAPRYRQASLQALKQSPEAVQIAYGDVARAFHYYVEHENRGRPFIIASHSQGSQLAIELLQREILGSPLRKQLVAAYVVGEYVTPKFSQLGLPACESARQTGCIMSWNTGQSGRGWLQKRLHENRYWWNGQETPIEDSPGLCINPLTWTPAGVAPADSNGGSLPFPSPPFLQRAGALPSLWPHLTGAACKNGVLEVDVPFRAPSGYHNRLSLFTGSYHTNDYGMFYAAIRGNAIDRVQSFIASRQ